MKRKMKRKKKILLYGFISCFLLLILGISFKSKIFNTRSSKEQRLVGINETIEYYSRSYDRTGLCKVNIKINKFLGYKTSRGRKYVGWSMEVTRLTQTRIHSLDLHFILVDSKGFELDKSGFCSLNDTDKKINKIGFREENWEKASLFRIKVDNGTGKPKKIFKEYALK